MPINLGLGVEDFDAFRKELKAAGPAAVKELAKGSKQLSQEIADRASAQAMALGSTAQHVAAAGAIKSVQSSTGVYIRYGQGQPAALGAEFGGQRRPTTQQFKPWLGQTGYFLYPTVRALTTDAEVGKRFGTLMTDLLTKHGATI